MPLRIRPDLASLPVYKAGQKLAARADLQTFKLSSNENPFAPLPSVLKAIEKAAANVNRYPDPLNTELIAKLAQRFGVATEQIAVSTGSVALLGNIMQAMAAADDEVIYAWRSFEAYPIWAQISGVKSVQVPLTQDFSHDLDAMAAAITNCTRVILICTPNNPTGNAVAAAKLHEFMTSVPEDVLVVIDEAYCEFVTDQSAAKGLEFFAKYPNVAVLRTFSKAYGLAGLRIGYAIAPVELADFLRRTAIPFGVSNIAQAAAVAALAAESELMARVQELVVERERVVSQLRALGLEVHNPQANFYWLATAEGAAIQAACEEVGVAIRPFPAGLRITIGEREANDRVLAVLAAHLP